MTEFTRGGVDDVGHDSGIEELAEGFTKFFLRLELIHHGVEGGGEFPDSAEALDIGEEDGGFSAIGRLAEFPSIRVDDIGHDTGIEKVAKRFAKSFFRFELLDHGVERGGQVTDLILGSDWKGIGVFAVGGLMKGGGESAKSGLQSASDTKKDEESQPAGEGKENQVGPNDMVNILVRFQD